MPRPCTCGDHEGRQWVSGQVHGDDEPCPLREADDADCRCFFDGRKATDELQALKEGTLAWCMYEDMTHGEVLAFADELAKSVVRLRERYAQADVKPHGAEWGGPAGRYYSTFEQALDVIAATSRWFRRVGELGYGVHGWY